MFSYTPVTEEQAEKERQFPLLEPGIYSFEVNKATFKMSNSGQHRDPSKPSNPMIELALTVWNDEGKNFTIYDYLIDTPKMRWKQRHFCKSVGLEKEYDEGTFNETLCEGKMGKCKVIYKAGQKKPDGTYYKDKNSVEDYVTSEKNSTEEEFKDDEIPF